MGQRSPNSAFGARNDKRRQGKSWRRLIQNQERILVLFGLAGVAGVAATRSGLAGVAGSAATLRRGARIARVATTCSGLAGIAPAAAALLGATRVASSYLNTGRLGIVGGSSRKGSGRGSKGSDTEGRNGCLLHIHNFRLLRSWSDRTSLTGWVVATPVNHFPTSPNDPCPHPLHNHGAARPPSKTHFRVLNLSLPVRVTVTKPGINQRRAGSGQSGGSCR